MIFRKFGTHSPHHITEGMNPQKHSFENLKYIILELLWRGSKKHQALRQKLVKVYSLFINNISWSVKEYAIFSLK